MSDPGLNADLTLDISAALAEVSRLQADLEAAVGDLVATVTADTQDVAPDVEAAVDSADTTAQVEADTQDVPAEIEAAVDGADSTTQVEADTADVPAEIEAAVDGADTTAQVEADAADVTSGIESAVDGADTTATIISDASDVTSGIEGAVAGADTTVTVQADANVAGLEAALATVNSELAATQAQVAQLESELGRLGSTGQQTGQQLSVSFRQLATLIGTVLAGQFAQTGVAFNQLQQTSRAALTTILDGSSAATAQMAELTAFTSESPFPLDEFIQAQQVLLAFGFAAEDVVPTLSAIQDAVAATGQEASAIGEITQILAQVNSTGQFTADVFNQLGIRGVNAAEIIAAEMGTTAAEVRRSVTSGALDAQDALQALTRGMSREFEGAAEGVRNTFAGARDRVRAALRDISSDLFATFVDPQGGGAAVVFFNDLADSLRLFRSEAGPFITAVSGGMVPLLEVLGQSALPAVAESLAAIMPLLGTTGVLTQALVPPIQLLSTILQAIPAPVLQAAAAFAFLNRINAGLQLVNIGRHAQQAALGAAEFARNAGRAQVETGSWRNALSGTVGPMRALASAIGPSLVVTLGLTAAMTALASRQQAAAERAAEQRARIETLRTALAEAETAAEGLALGLERLAEEGDDSARGVAAAGLSAEDLSAAIAGAESSTDALIAAVQASDIGERFDEDTFSVEDFSNTLAETGDVAGAMFAAFDGLDLGESFTDAQVEVQGLVAAIEMQIGAVDELAEQELAAAVIAGDLTAEQVAQMEATGNLTGAWLDWRRQLEAAEAAQRSQINLSAEQAVAAGRITSAQAQAISSTEDLTEADQLLTDALERSGDAALVVSEIYDTYAGAGGRAAQQSLEVADALSTVDQVLAITRDSVSDAGEGFISLDLALQSAGVEMSHTGSASDALDRSMAELALSIDAAGLSGEALEKIAVGLGVNVQDLDFFVAQTAATVNDFVAAVEGNIPTVSEALGELDDLTLTGIRDSIEDTLDAINEFADDLDVLSIRPALQRLAAEEGPELASILAQATRDGNTAMLDEMEQGLVDIDTARGGLIEDARSFALEFALAMGFIAEHGVEAFADQFDLTSPTLDEVNRTGDALSDAAIALADEGDTAGRSVVEKYGDGISGMVPETARNTRGAVDALSSQEGNFGVAGQRDGEAGRVGMRRGLAPMPGETGATADLAVGAIRNREGAAQSAGSGLGGSVRSGVASGVAGMVGIVRAEARAAADAPKGISGFGAGQSIGSSITSGIVAGINAGVGSIAAAAAAAARSAESAAKGALGIASPSRVFAEIGEDIGDGLAEGILAHIGEVTAATEQLVAAVVGVEPPVIPVGVLDPQIAGLAGPVSVVSAGFDAGDGGTVMHVTVQAGAVVINVPAGTAPAEAELLGDRAARGFLQTLAERRVQTEARIA